MPGFARLRASVTPWPPSYACGMSDALDVAAVQDRLAAWEDPRARAVNERHGDDHGVNLTKLRGLAKEIGANHSLALQLWETGDTATRLVAILIARPREFPEAELDTMLREARVPKVHDWFVNYIVKKSPHAEALRVSWLADPDPIVASAGWGLTTARIVKRPEGLDLTALLDRIEAEIVDAPERLQWAMNLALGEIGIRHPEHRDRVLEMGERLGVLRDYPTPPGCVSPFVPLWVPEMVRRLG